MRFAHTDHYERMLNAGFCGLVVTSLTEGACGRDTSAQGLSLISIYLLAPLILHQDASARIKRSPERGLAEFITSHPRLSIGLEYRIMNALPHVRSGLSLALARNAIEFNKNSGMVLSVNAVASRRDSRLRELLASDDYDRVKSSLQLGRWTSHMSVAQICSALTVRPVWTHAAQTIPDEEQPIARPMNEQ